MVARLSGIFSSLGSLVLLVPPPPPPSLFLKLIKKHWAAKPEWNKLFVSLSLSPEMKHMRVSLSTVDHG